MTSLNSPATFSVFMQQLATRQSPALLWYSVPGERVELSGRVLDNWVSKTANLLLDEGDVEPGDRVVLPSRLHWRSIVLALAALRVGAELVFEPVEGARVEAGFDPALLAGSEAEMPLLLAEQPLAPRFLGEVPPGLVDYAAEVRSHPDVFMGYVEAGDHDWAWAGTGYGQLMEDVRARVAEADQAGGAGASAWAWEATQLTAPYLVDLLAALSSGAAALVLDPTIEWSEERISRVLADEQARFVRR